MDSFLLDFVILLVIIIILNFSYYDFLMLALQEHYSEEYLHGLKERIPGFSNYTRDQLLSALANNHVRWAGVYEEDMATALDRSEYQGDEKVLDLLFSSLSQAQADKISSWAAYVRHNKMKHGDVVLGIELKDQNYFWMNDRVGSATFEDRSFVNHRQDQQSLSADDKVKRMLVLSMNLVNISASLQDIYKLTPSLMDIPPKKAEILDGIYYKKELNAEEFRQSLAQFVG